MKSIINGKIITDNKLINNGYILYNDNIIEIGEGEAPSLAYSKAINTNGSYVIPGLIDIHTHGNSGMDTMDSHEIAISTIASFLAQHGVTSFLPTTMTSDISNMHKALDNIRVCMRKNLNSRVLGCHLEGPFISLKKRGAQQSANIVTPNASLIEDYYDIVKIITYAPENDINNNFIKEIKNKNSNIVLSAGHTNASYEIANDAINKGMNSATHLFNGMTSLHHRNPGLVAAVLDRDIYCELIADNIHVHPVWYRLLLKTKGRDKLILISDSMKATGLKDGDYSFGGQDVTVHNSIARLKSNGSLAGSTLMLNKAAANFMSHTQASFVDVVKMVTANPAKLLGIDEQYGSLAVGKVADIVVCDKDFDVKHTILAGKEVYVS